MLKSVGHVGDKGPSTGLILPPNPPCAKRGALDHEGSKLPLGLKGLRTAEECHLEAASVFMTQCPSCNANNFAYGTYIWCMGLHLSPQSGAARHLHSLETIFLE